MSDSFADLWSSTGVAKPAQPPRKLGSLASTASPAAHNPRNDVFSMLASAGSSNSTRATTPAATGPMNSSRSLGSNGNVSAKPMQKASSSGADAFSGLLSGSFASNSNGANMTIAERAARVEQERLETLREQHGQSAGKQSPSAWAGLDALGNLASKSTTPQPAESGDMDWEFGLAPTIKPSNPPASRRVAQPAQDDWGLDDFISQPAPAKPVGSKLVSASKPAGSLWDFDDLESAPAPSSSRHSPVSSTLRSTSPGDFDFGDREDGLLDDNSNDEDDILGALNKPVGKSTPSRNKQTRASPSPIPPTSSQSRTVSPPPHIVGQIVEMGFSPQQARVALAATNTGLDVQAALETLLAHGAGAEETAPSRPRSGSRSTRRERYADSDDEPTENPAPRRRGPQDGRNGASRQAAEQPARESPSDTQAKLQEQADKILAQASVIGTTMFTRANAFWKEGKEKVQRAYEERSAASAASSSRGGGSANARPRWMQDMPERGQGADDGWHDDDGDGEVAEVLPPRPTDRPRAKQAEAKARPREPEAPSARFKSGDLLGGDDSPAVYVSRFRRQTPSRANIETSTSSSKPKAPPARAPSPVALVSRKTVPASPAQLASSAKHKATGSEMFKLGRYAEAETSYSAALSALPDAHLLRIPLFNNRALTRIKTGDHSGAAEDCTTVVDMIGAGFHPAREAKVTRADEGAGVDLGDALVKALRRRAEAHEGREKWDAARQDWEALAATDFAGKVRGEAVRGAGRCRRMLAANADTGAAASAPRTAPKPKPAPRPVRRGPTPPSEALNRVREATEAAEAEDQAKYELKDSVDARLGAWKNGKESNIRALIASLDTVLWPGLGWQKVGMHELVTPSQVKIRYTKAIAKLHPDKLHVNNTSVEERMIANGVFGSLNDAWNAFKQ